MLGVCLDVTERKKAETALRNSEQNYQFLLKDVRDYAIYMLDAEGNVRSWNDSAERLKGYSVDEISADISEFSCRRKMREFGSADQVLAAAVRDGQFEGETWMVRQDGSRFFASVVMDAIRGEEGDLLGLPSWCATSPTSMKRSSRSTRRANSSRSRRRWKRSAN